MPEPVAGEFKPEPAKVKLTRIERDGKFGIMISKKMRWPDDIKEQIMNSLNERPS